MKKYLIGFLLLLIACNMPTPTSTPPVIEATFPTTPQSTLIVDSAAQTFTPSPTSTPFPLYFTDEFTSASFNWQFIQTGGLNLPATTFENDSLRIEISSPDTWMIGINTAHTYNNVFVRTKATISPTGSFGLICRYDKNLGWYEFNIYNDGTYNLLYGKYLTEGVAKYIPISTEYSGYISASDEIGLNCQDNFLLLYVNDNLVKRVDVTNYGLGEGKIGITASSVAEAPTNVLFEWAKVSTE